MASFEDFRDPTEGCSGFIWSEFLSKWICGGSLGMGFLLSPLDKKTEQIQLASDDAAITAIAVHDGKRLLAYSTPDTVCVRSLDDLETPLEENLLRTTLPITHMQFMPSGDYLIISSQDSDLLFLHLPTRTVTNRIPTNGLGVCTFSLSADFHVAIVDMDGNVFVYALQQYQGVVGADAQAFVSKDMVSMHSKIFSKEAVRQYNGKVSLSWINPSASSATPTLLVPTKDALTLLSPSSASADGGKWTESFLFPTTPASPSPTFHLVRHDEAKGLIAAADLKGLVVVWRLVAGEAVEKAKEIKFIAPKSSPMLVDLSFQPKTGNDLVLLSAKGWKVEEGIVPVSLPVSNAVVADVSDDALLAFMDQMDGATAGEESATELQDSLLAASQAIPAAHPAVSSAPPRRRLHKTSLSDPLPASLASNDKTAGSNRRADDDDDVLFAEDDKPSAPAASKGDKPSKSSAKDSTAAKGLKSAHALFDDEAESDGDGVNDDDHDNYDGMDDDFIVDDADEKAQGRASGVRGLSELSAADIAKLSSLVAPAPHPAFQPSSTKPDDKAREYFVWNHIGSIVHRTDNLESRVEVRFTSGAAGRGSEVIQDRAGYVMGGLSQDGAVFCTAPEEGDDGMDGDADMFSMKLTKGSNAGKGSVLYFHSFKSSGGRTSGMLGGGGESWRYPLPGQEGVVCLTAGRGWVGALTSKRYVRLLSAGGLELAIRILPGSPVCLVGCEDKVAVVYDMGTAGGVVMEVWAIEPWMGRVRQLTNPLPLPLPAQGKVTWVGWDVSLHTPLFMDSKGEVSMLMAEGGGVGLAGWMWVPVLSVHAARKSPDHSWWPVCVKGDRFLYILLNAERHPAIYPPPVTSYAYLRLPLGGEGRGGKKGLGGGVEVGGEKAENAGKVAWGSMKIAHLEGRVAIGDHGVSAGDMEEMHLQAVQDVEKLLLGTFVEALRSGNAPLALALGGRLSTPKGVSAAVFIANNEGRAGVAKGVEVMWQEKLRKMGAGQQEEGGVDEQNDKQQHGYDDVEEEEVGIAAVDRASMSEEMGNTGGGILSRKASLKNQLPALPKAVSPSDDGEAVGPGTRPKVVNPFAVHSKNNTTPIKRKLEDTPMSPSPKLNRSSTFAQQARTHRLTEKKML